jgi:UDP-2-acetamido-3-amino-2,3-dideoxy-glucuronate N-acetyltransferase
MRCPESGLRYKETAGVLKCLDLNEEAPLPAEMTKGTKTYRQFKDAKS